MESMRQTVCFVAVVLLAGRNWLLGQEPRACVIQDEEAVCAFQQEGDLVLEWYSKSECTPTRHVSRGSRLVSLSGASAGRVLVVEVVGLGREATTRLSVMERVGSGELEVHCWDTIAIEGFEAVGFGRIGPLLSPEIRWALVGHGGDRILIFDWSADQKLPPRQGLRTFENVGLELGGRREPVRVEATARGFLVVLERDEFGIHVEQNGELLSVADQEPRDWSAQDSERWACWAIAPTEGCLVLGAPAGRHEKVPYQLVSRLGEFVLLEGTVPDIGRATVRVPEVFRAMPGLDYVVRGGGVRGELIRPLLEMGPHVGTPTLGWYGRLMLDAAQLRGGGSVEVHARFDWSARDRSRLPRAWLLMASGRSDQDARDYWRGPLLDGCVAHCAPLEVGRHGFATMNFSLVLPSNRGFVGCLLALQLVVEDERGDFAISPIVGACIQPDLHEMNLPATVVDGATYTQHWTKVASTAHVDEFRNWLRSVLPDGPSQADELRRRFSTRRQVPRPK